MSLCSPGFLIEAVNSRYIIARLHHVLEHQLVLVEQREKDGTNLVISHRWAVEK